jgi:hypothetical protein
VRKFLRILIKMTKSKAQKARAKAAKAGQPKQKGGRQPKQPAQRKQNKQRRNRDGGGDNSQTRGGNGGQLKTQEPRVGVIEKRELITLVSGTTGFQALKFSVNPGLPKTFPIGATEAKNWTEWRCTQMRVDYIPTVSEFATQGQQGEVAIAVDYNADNALPTAMNQIEAMHFAGGGIPSKGFAFMAKPKLLNKADPKYVRLGPVPAGDDLRLYDGGSLYFATSGCTNTTQIGKLEVTYRFEMGLPTLLNVGQTNDSDVSWFQSTSGEAAGATGVAANVAMATASFNGLGAVNTAGSIVPPAGNYVVSIDAVVANSSSAMTAAQVDIQKNGVTLLKQVPILQVGAAATGVIFSLHAQAFIQCNGTDAITFPLTATYSAGTTTMDGSVLFTNA